MNITVPAVNSVEVSVDSPSQVNVSTATSFSATVTNKGPKGDTGATGATGPQGDPGQGLAAGGTTSQLLVKSSGDDYDTSWTSDLSVNSATVSNNITNIGSLVNLGGITTIGNLSAGSISGVSTATINTGNISTLNSGQLYFNGTAAASIFHNDGLYDRLGIYSDGGILNVLDHNNDNIDDQFVIADHSLTPLMVVNSTGNVGIGTTSPAYRLDVSGGDINLPLGNYIRFGSQLGIKKVNIGAMHFYAGTNSTTGGFDFATWNGSSYDEGAFVIRNSGNVGIGTTSPSYKLHVDGGTIGSDLDSTANNISRQVNMTSANTTGMNTFTAYNTNTDATPDFLGKYGYKLEGGTATANKQFQVYVSDLSNPRMVINGSGNVGIGTTSPRGKLDARGRVDFSNDLRLRGTDSLEDQGVARFYVDNTNKLHIDTANNGSNLFVVDGSGNVGIGTTTPSEKLHVSGSIRVDTGDRISMGSSGLSMFHSGTYAETTNYTGDFVIRNTAANKDIIFKAEAGTGSDVEIMRIDGSSGNVGIGTTSPTSKLHVEGAAFINNGLLKVQDSSVTNYYESDQMNSYGTYYDWKFAGSRVMRINSSGNVGIGTTSPSAKLDVAGLVNINDGSNNVMISSANTALTTGSANSSVGYNTLKSVTSGSYNSAFGSNALESNLTGVSNSAFGTEALRYNTGANNTAFGTAALRSKTSGDNNSAFGVNALYNNLTGSNNIAVGRNAGYYTTGNNNALIGYYAGHGASGASTFSNATAVGYQALYDLTTGDHNTAIGYQASANVNTGDHNVSLGNYALYRTQTGGQNTAIGYGAAYETLSGFNTAVGFISGYYGNSYNTSLGARALNYSTGSYNVALGAYAAQGDGTSNFSNTVAVGYQALYDLTTGATNTAVGYQAGLSNTEGDDNTFVGAYAGQANTTGNNNSFFGRNAGYANTSGSVNSFLGVSAGRYNTTGYSNTFLGGLAGNQNTIGYSNSFVGVNAGYSNTSGDNNCFFGRGAGYTNSTGSGNVFIGYQAGYYETGGNKLYIANDNTTTPLIYGEFDNDILRVNGTLEVTEGITVDETGLASAGDYGKGSEVWYQGTGATTAGSLYYLNSSGNWSNTDASAASTAKGMLAFAAGTDSDVDGMVIKGFVYLGTDAGGSVGDPVYLSETANLVTTTAPTTSGSIVRVVGYKVATNVIWFNPSNDYFEVE